MKTRADQSVGPNWNRIFVLLGVLIAVFVLLAFVALPQVDTMEYSANASSTEKQVGVVPKEAEASTTLTQNEPSFFAKFFGMENASGTPAVPVATATPSVIPKVAEGVSHRKTPIPVKAIYVSQCAATTKSFRDRVAKLVTEREINSVIIDVKDFTGALSFRAVDKDLLSTYDHARCPVKDMKEYIAELHEADVYVIARIQVFQDPLQTKLHPELAVKRASDGGTWKDHKGLAFVDVSAKPHWEYIAKVGEESYLLGFDELNFDYIRYPSDGNMKDISYTWAKGRSKSEALRLFYEFLHDRFQPQGIPISADLFGMTTTQLDDMNIGQVLEDAARNFDYVAPMVYPSHYPVGFNGWKNPNIVPYEVVKFSMSRAVERLRLASLSPTKLRPWLQDFQYGGTYGVPEIRAQIRATYDSGLDSWMMWDPKVEYTAGAYHLKDAPADTIAPYPPLPKPKPVATTTPKVVPKEVSVP